MGNITDQLFVLNVILNLLFCILFQTNPHLFKVLTELSNLIVFFHIHGKVQIAVPNFSNCFLKLADWLNQRPVNPHGHSCRNKNQHKHPGNQHLHDHASHFRIKFVKQIQQKQLVHGNQHSCKNNRKNAEGQKCNQ